ncbi:MAG: proline dehydrogenase family protein [Bacteroidales bacterium]|nr:proline dehydrogenase family protein [Bacteroidales bacterium]
MFNKIIASTLPVLPKKLVWVFSKKYIAGETLADALRVSSELNSAGIEVSLDVLGEFETSAEKIEYYKSAYINTINESVKAGIKTTFSVKPTMFGLLLDKQLCFKHIYELVQLASQHNCMVRIDMEDATCTTLELELFKEIYNDFPDHTGIVLQAYLKRTLEDLKELNKLNNPHSPVNVRLCKGIYNEPVEIAYKKKEEINLNFIGEMEYLFANKFYAAIATHDESLINAAYELIWKYHVPNNMVEFQMLYGVTPELRKTITGKGFKMRVYVPFGKDWFNYSTRRLKENPKMVSHIVKALFIRK